MTFQKKLFSLFACISFIIAAVGAAVQFFAFYSGYDLDIRHFENGNPLAIAAGCICAAGIVLAILSVFVTRKKIQFTGKFKLSSPIIFISVYCGFLLIGSVIVTPFLASSKHDVNLLSVLRDIAAVVSGIYLILSVFAEISEKTFVKALSLVPPLWLGFAMMNSYHVMDSAMNDPFQLYYTVLLASLLLYFTAQAGITFHPQSRSGFYTFSSIMLLSSGGTVIITRLILSLIQKTAFNISIMEALLFLGLYFYAALKFITLDNPSEFEEPASADDKTDTEKIADANTDINDEGIESGSNE